MQLSVEIKLFIILIFCCEMLVREILGWDSVDRLPMHSHALGNRVDFISH